MIRRLRGKPRGKPIITVVHQRGDADCAIAALAMLCNVTYEEVLIAAARVAPCENGMYLTQIRQVASELGLELVSKRPKRYSLASDAGIIYVYDKRISSYHVAILRRGLIIDTDGSIWDADVYLATKRYKAGSLLVTE